MITKILKEILTKSFSQGIVSFKNSLTGIKTWLFGGAGSFFSTNTNIISQDMLTWWPLFNNNWLNFGVVLILLLFIIFLYFQARFFVIESWRRWILIKRESVYGKAIVLLAEGYSQIHKYSKIDTTDEQTKTILTQFCNNIKEIFEYKTQAQSSVSIKVIADFHHQDNVANLNSRVENLVRDSESESRNSANYKVIQHTVAKNTCYQRVLTNFMSGNKQDKLFFLSNDLPGEVDYENSSFEQYPDFVDISKEDSKQRRTKWPLEYKSELVVPISAWDSTKEDELAILGFLCIDCQLEKKEVFNEEYDVKMIKGIADGLYDFIKIKVINNE